MSVDPSRLRSIRRKLTGLLRPVLAAGHRLFTPRLDLSSLDPVLVLGNQKTGSTAIARLLAHLGRLRAVTDIPPLQSADTHLPTEPDAIAAFVQRMRYYFRHDVVKENELTPATDALLTVLPQARPVYVVRHPVHNIRSILDRVGLPAHPEPLDALSLPENGWRPIVTSRPLGVEASDHITALAKRWRYMTGIYQRHRERLHLVRYEDFTADKTGTIRTLAAQLGIEPRQDIQPLLDVPFQPRGAHRSLAPEEFFSDEALEIINRHCAEGMEALHYEPVAASST